MLQIRKVLVGYFRLFTISIMLLGLTNCRIVQGLKYLNQEKVEIYNYSNGVKSVSFVSNHHLGKPQYYENLKTTVKYYKSQGYIVFYEQVKASELTDSVSRDIESRKFRKLLGFIPDRDLYNSAVDNYKYLKKYIVQPEYKELGIGPDDVHVDLSRTEMIAGYEKKYGEIILNSTDLHTPVNKRINKACDIRGFLEIAVNLRNENLAEKITTLNYDKILIIYGATHRKGTFKILKGKDPNWGKINHGYEPKGKP